MSQAGSNAGGGGGGGGSTTTFQTGTGSAQPAANILIVLADDSTENDANGINTVGSGNTVTVQLTNRLQGTGQSVAAANADLISFSLGASAACFRFQFLATGISSAGAAVGQGVGYSVNGSARTDGATATIISTPDIDADEDAALAASSIDLVASGNNIILRANGIAGETIDYSAVGEYLRV